MAGTELQVHAPTRQRMQDHYGPRGLEINEARLRMATLPSPGEVSLWQVCCPFIEVSTVSDQPACCGPLAVAEARASMMCSVP